MRVIHRFSQPGCLSYWNFSQIFPTVLTVCQNNIQQPGERERCSHRHTLYVWRRKAISPHFKPADVNRDWKSLKCTQTDKKKSPKYIHSHVVKDQNRSVWNVILEWCCKKTKKLHSHIFFLQIWTRAEEIYNQHVCVYSCRINHKIRWWITLTLYQ